MSAAQQTVTVEQAQQVDLIHLPMFSINTVRSFLQDPKVWGKSGDVYWDDVLIHVRDGNTVTSYTDDEATLEALPNGKELTEGFLDNHSDKALVYIESGFVTATKPESTTRFVRTVATDPSFKYNGHKWSSELADVILARESDSPKDLKL